MRCVTSETCTPHLRKKRGEKTKKRAGHVLFFLPFFSHAHIQTLSLSFMGKRERELPILVRLGGLKLPLFEKKESGISARVCLVDVHSLFLEKKREGERKNKRARYVFFFVSFQSHVKYVSSSLDYTHISKPPHSHSRGRDRGG